MPLFKKANSLTDLEHTLHSSFQRHRTLIKGSLPPRKHSDDDYTQIAPALYQCFFEHSSAAMLITDADCKILRVNSAFVWLTGYTIDHVIGQSSNLLSSGLHDKSFYEQMWASINQKGCWQGELLNRHISGDLFFVWQSIAAIKDHNHQVINYISTFSDISILKDAQRKLWDMAHIDVLSGLANRVLFGQRLVQEIVAAKRSGQFGAVIFLDLDGFKKINDCFGHRCGDKVLQEVAKRLLGNFRDEDTVARLGGDEFVILLSELTHNLYDAKKTVSGLAKKTLSSLAQVFIVDGQKLQMSASLGVTFFSGDFSESTEQLLRQADVAMYSAKTSGKNAYQFYHPRMLEKVNRRLVIETQLRTALQKNDQIVLFYQPQYDSTHQLLGFEALVRWQHPEKGMISPADFMPIAEETGIIIDLGERILYLACQQLSSWHAQGFNVPQLAINISPVQFYHLNFVDVVTSILELTGANPLSVMLEITENMIIKDVDDVIEKMRFLKQIGIRFSIDDFGTGYSSLSYLKYLPIDQLKIDRSFVQDIAHNANDAAIVNTIISLAGNLKLEVIAEGVETLEQLNCLVCNGCNAFQGYWFNRPLPSAEILSKCG